MTQSLAPEPVHTVPPAESGTGESSACEEQAVANENGGRGGLDPTRYGDWEKNGRCIDF